MTIDRWDCCIIAGGLLLAVGCGLWALPFGFVVGGLELLAVGVLGAKAFPVKPVPSHDPRTQEA